MGITTILAVESHGIGPPWSQLAVPLGFAIFIGLTFMLVRSNLGTRRGYLVTFTSLFGFMVIYSLFWTFGAPGTPANTGPQNLPGQELDAYQPVYRMFAPDSLIAEDPTYDVVQDYPNGFTAQIPAGVDPVLASDETKTFFSTESEYLTDPPLDGTDVVVEDEILYATATNDYPIVAVKYVPTYQPASGAEPEEGEEPPLTPRGEPLAEDGSNQAPAGTEIGDPVDGAEPVLFFAYFDAGSPYFPSLLMLTLMVVLFGLHLGLLFLDESRERREKRPGDEVAAGEKVRVEA